MDGRGNFWLDLHNLVTSILMQGDQPVERTNAIIEAYHRLEPHARDEALAELRAVLLELQSIHATIRMERVI